MIYFNSPDDVLLAISQSPSITNKNMADEETIPEEVEIAASKEDEGVEDPASEIGSEDEKEKQPSLDASVDEESIPVRGSAAHVIARQKRTIEKLRSKSEDVHTEPDDDDDELTPEADRAIAKKVDERTAVIMDLFTSKADEEELSNLFRDEPESKAYEKRIRSYMKHPAYKAVPPSAIFHQLAYKEAAGKRAEAKRIADLEAGSMAGGGTTHRREPRATGNMPSASEIENMSDDEFQKLQDDVQQGKYKNS